jgi:hypothetical protein
MAGKTPAKAAKAAKKPSNAAQKPATKASSGKPAKATASTKAAKAAPKPAAKRTAVKPANAAKTTGKPAKNGAQGKPALLSGGNPQIPKGYGDAPVRAYIAAMPGWKRDIGRRMDALVVQAVPGVRKAVKWNSPFYGVEEGRYFLSFHCFNKFVRVTFFDGESLRPPPAGPSKLKNVRYLDVYQDAGLDEAQFADWVEQASKLPGERM